MKITHLPANMQHTVISKTYVCMYVCDSQSDKKLDRIKNCT
jgi:hypothetical protein